MASLLCKVSNIVAACTRRVSRATRRLLRTGRLRRGGSLERQLVPAVAAGGGINCTGGDEDGEGLWRREILMGKRCAPPNFSGAIHYDSLGRRLPAPRDGKLAALFCRSSEAVDEGTVRHGVQES